jgi:hypothetical protein
MKVTNWRRKLSAALIAGGLLSPSAAQAAGLNVNLVTNGDFENVNLNVVGSYNGPLVLNWTGPSLFAYSHDGSSSSTGVVPDYADGADPPGAGHWYFTPNNTGSAPFTDVHDPDTYFQDIDVSTGATATAIAAGQARFNLSAYMTSYLNDTDFGNVRVEFKNGGGGSLGFVQISDPDFGPNNVWSLSQLTGVVPIGTATARVSLFGTRTAGGAGADGYTDNVDFRITQVPEPSTVAMVGASLAAGGLGFLRRRRRQEL